MSGSDQRPGAGLGEADTVDGTRGLVARARALGDDLAEAEPGRYRIDGEVAQGGLGRVLRAHDTRLKRTVALKELGAGAASEAGEVRFVREALITASLEHPSIVPVHDAGRWPGGRPFYAMKLVSGRTLEEVVGETGSLAERLALLPRVIAVAEAIAYAHSRRIIHRDIKPSNVVLGQYGETVVIDWGLAKALGSSSPDERQTVALRSAPVALPVAPPSSHGSLETMAGSVLGTPAYMAPEQARGEDVDERADVYALGALLYHVLAGVPPHTGAASRTSGEGQAGVVVPVARRQPGVPVDLAAIVDKAMAPGLGARYPSAAELAGDLRRFHTGQLVSAHAYSRGERLGRLVRKNRALVAVVIGAAAVLLGFGSLAVARVIDERNTARGAQRSAEQRRIEADDERLRAEAARRQTDERNRELLLLQAGSSLDRDPTAALAWLALYPQAGARWDTVRTLVEDAVSRGVARHVWRGHERGVWALAFSPDARTLASASADHSVRLWSVGGAAGPRLAGEGGEVNGVAYSPDGRSLATVSDDGGVRLVDPLSGVARLLGRHEGAAVAVSFSPDGRLVASGGYDRSVRVFATSGDAPARDFPLHASRVQRVAFSPDGAQLVSTSDDASVRLIELASGRSRLLGKHERGSFGVAFSPDGSVVASSGRDRTIRLWSLRGQPPRTLSGHEETVFAVVFSPDGRSLASASLDRTVRVWDLARGEARVLRGHEGGLMAVAWSPDGRLLASAGVDRSVRLWNAPRGESRVVASHGQEALTAVFSPDGARLASAGADGVIRLTELASATTLELRGHTGVVAHLAWTPDGLAVLSGGRDRQVWRWDARSGRGEPLHTMRGAISGLAVSRDGQYLAAGDDRVIWLWSAASRQGRELPGRDDSDAGVVFAPDGRSLASASAYEVAVWDAESGTRRLVTRHEAWVKAVAYSPDGRSLASAGADRRVRISSLPDGATRVLGEHDMVITALAYSPDGQVLAAAGQDGVVKLWGVADGQVRVLDGHTLVAWKVVFSPDGRRLASASSDGTARLWSLDGGRVRVLREHQGGAVHSVGFSPDGATLVSSGHDGTVRAWLLDAAAEVPGEPAALAAWIAARTSARLVPGDRPLLASP